MTGLLPPLSDQFHPRPFWFIVLQWQTGELALPYDISTTCIKDSLTSRRRQNCEILKLEILICIVIFRSPVTR